MSEEKEQVTFTLDGAEVSVPRGTTVLEAALQCGIDIPYFCWHPKLKPVGACRMCYIEIEKSPKLQVSCCIEATNGMVVSTNSDKVQQGRKAVIEFTLVNHPLDCPTCDKGGECDLQDLTFEHGFDDSRFDFQKYRFMSDGVDSTFDDLRIGPEIVLNRNRCILCYKCVRANKEAFGEYDLGAFERGNITEINAAPGKEVDNPFSGNLVEICPVGALTNTDWRYQIRVWLTQQKSSICPFTSSGSNTCLYYEYHRNRVFRVTGRCNDEIDDGWISDVTRYGYQIVNSDERLKKPLVKKEGTQVESTWEEALKIIGKRIGEIVEKKGCVCVGGLIHPGLDNATLYSFNKFIRDGIGSQNIDYRTDYRMLPEKGGTPYDILASRPFRIADIDTSDLIVTFATDLIKEHPNEYLRIRKAYSFSGARVFTLNPYAVKSSDVAEQEIIYRIGTDESLINAICLAALEGGMVTGSDFDGLKEAIRPGSLSEAAALCGVNSSVITDIAQALADSKHVTFIAGELISRSREREMICSALCNLNRLFGIEKKGQIAVLARYANSKGADKLGLGPHTSEKIASELKQIWGMFPDVEQHNTDSMLARMRKEEINSLIVMGADPMTQYPDKAFAREGLERVEFLVVADMFETATTALADVVLPLSSWTEYKGEYLNLEGRLQTSEATLRPKFESQPGSEIINRIAQQLEITLFDSDAKRDAEIEQLLKIDTTLPWPDSWLGVRPFEEESSEEYPIPLVIGDDPHHCGHITEKSESLMRFRSEAYVEISPKLAAKLKIGKGDTVRIFSKVGKVVVSVKISDYMKGDVIFMPRNFSATAVTSLLMRRCRVDRVKIESLDG